jgi:quercetin dioxygenase-like cupin family protein
MCLSHPEPNKQGGRTVPVIRNSDAPIFTFTMPGQDPKIPTPHLKVQGYAAPSRGSKEMCVWRITLAPGLPQRTGTVDHEEFFMVLSGAASITLDGTEIELNPGDGVIVPANTLVGMGNLHDEPVEMVEVCPAGIKVSFPGMEPFTPAWAE